ncbi:probable fatty acyl-CoA reductase 5 [Papaver somniferum]|uniref:probable fatty acyl-CoA reductase 5 n=1 Tax=Papaver somniferum TaxID=3469 RepID=UPI000E705AEC|nr:probable fatty acyl-CoA reductase 5 [Papaver somniferum]
MEYLMNGSITESLENKTILVTGSTGFLAKVFVEKLLRVQPNVRHLFLLLRAPNTSSAAQRLHTEVQYEPVIKALMHGKDKMTYAEVTTTLRSEELRKMDREDLASEANNDLLLARGRSTDRRKKAGGYGKGRGRSKSIT